MIAELLEIKKNNDTATNTYLYRFVIKLKNGDVRNIKLTKKALHYLIQSEKLPLKITKGLKLRVVRKIINFQEIYKIYGFIEN